MSILPGLQESSNVVDYEGSIGKINEVKLLQGTEWRARVSNDAKLVLKILHGIAELFGTELANNVEYTFQSARIGIYAVEQVEFEWKCSEILDYSISSDTSMRYIYNLHFALEKMRLSSFNGPRIAIVGESCSGKTTLAKTICSYAIKNKLYQPLYVNMNPQEGIFTPPGCLSATPISSILDVESASWGQSMTSGATKFYNKQPIVKNFGLENISENRELYLEIMNQLSNVVSERLKNDSVIRRSGIVIDMPPMSDLDSDYNELTSTINRFQVNALVVCAEDDSLAIKLSEKYQKEIRSIVRIPTNPGVVKIDDITRRTIQKNQIREYFYGNINTILSPYTIGVDASDITVWKPKSRLNIQNFNITSFTELESVVVNGENLQNALVAITNANRGSFSDIILKSSILGYAFITEVNDLKKKLRILLPVPGRLPNKAMILTSYRYLE